MAARIVSAGALAGQHVDLFTGTVLHFYAAVTIHRLFAELDNFLAQATPFPSGLPLLPRNLLGRRTNRHCHRSLQLTGCKCGINTSKCGFFMLVMV